MNKLSQQEYSDIIKTGLLTRFPEFKRFVRYVDDVLIIEIPSPMKTQLFWISTQDMEITIGFDNANGDCSWHTHMSLYGAYEIDDELRTLIHLLTDIFEGNELLVLEDNEVIYLTKNPEDELKNNEDNKILDFKKWNEI
ncbi:hypothetical protein [Prolixibacter sp. NT017]|uniref:hypothetical protein n=1 Tax=Prolixibacter sp. NT017 TaxID=2652390 RepID=UPI00127E1821|nr:hypothetical protein [Prolixibacter sp. NT017]GET25387.1 hypothetical protein NT017_17160 [Prolixibacter sp. NT017]